jgi:hypothetical protein
LASKEPLKSLEGYHKPQKPSSRLGFRVWLASLAGLSLIFGMQSFYPDLIGPLSNVFPTVCAAGVFGSATLCLRRYGFGLKKFEAVWFCFVLGTGLWVLAEATWSVYYFVLNVEVPYPSVADFFYVGGYLPIILGLGAYLSSFRIGMSRRRLAFAAGTIALAVSLAMSFVLPIQLAQDLSPVNLLTDLLYPVLDLVLLSLAVLSLAIFYGGTIAKWWMLFSLGAALYVIADEYFLYQVAQGTYYNGGLDDFIFLIGYLFLALGFYIHTKEF